MMCPAALLLALLVTAAGCAGADVGLLSEQEEGYLSVINFIELEYEDQCNAKGEADWNELIGAPDALNQKLEQDKAISNTIHTQMEDLKESSADYDAKSGHYPLLNRRLELLLAPGDALLGIEQYSRLVSFGDVAVHKLEHATDYECGGDPHETCTLTDVRRRLASERSESVRLRIKASWERKLADESVYLTQVLPLLKNASTLNGYDSVEAYWDALAEYEGGMVRARELWANLQPLYEKLQRYVAMRLKAAGYTINTDTTIPVHALGSLLGDDWSNVIEHVLPKHAELYEVIKKNLVLKHMGGREAFIKASKLIKELNLGEVEEQFWTNSLFDKSCPTRLVDFCVRGSMRAFTCNDVSFVNFLEAHESLMRVRYRELGAAYSNNTYVLRESNRYSAVYEGVAGLAPLLAVTPHQLDRAKLVSVKYFQRNADHNRNLIQLILALQDLPKLNYYLAADEWRLKTLKDFPAPIPLGKSWSDYRRSFSLVAPGDRDFLGDPQILLNKPYLGKFMGIILKYQIYQSFIDEMFDSQEDIVEHVASKYHRILEPMTRAFSVKWPELVSDILSKHEYGIDSSGILEYFGSLGEHLDRELDPSVEPSSDYFDQPLPSDMFEATSQRRPDELDVDTIETSPPPHAEKEDISEPDASENVLENKILIKKEDMKAIDAEKAPAPLQKDTPEVQKAGAYSLYLWVGIGVVLAIVLILILVVAKKRYSHRRALERERKEGSRA